MTFDSSFRGIAGDEVLRSMGIWGDERLFSRVRNPEREKQLGAENKGINPNDFIYRN